MSADTVTPPPVTPPTPQAAPSAPAPAPISRRRRWLRRLLPLLTLLVLVVWFAPAIVAKTELRNRCARQALANLHGSVEIGGASLGWFSPLELHDVTIKDEAGRTIASVPKITSRKSLLDLACNQAEPGDFTLENPTISLVCAKDATNLEKAFAEYLKDDGTPTSPTRTPVAIHVTGGTVTFIDADTNQSANIKGLNADVAVPANRPEPITAKITATTGNLSADISVADSSSATLKSAGFPLDTFAPILKRVDPTMNLAGTFTSDLRITWGKDAAGKALIAVAGSASVKQLVFAGPGMNGDTLRLDSADLPLDAAIAGRVVRVQKFNLTCDVGTVSATGTFDPDESTDKLLTRPGTSVSANIDVAKFAAKLPKLLRVKDGTELREGKLEATLTSRADAGGVVWDGKVHTSALKAMRDGKPINWEQPLSVEFLARYVSGQLPTFDKLICTSDFIAVNARTTPETIQAAANIYLNRLATRLAEFIDLGGVALDGEASASLVSRRQPDGSFTAGAEVELKNFAFADHTGKGLKEPALKLHLAATGKAPSNAPIELKTASAALIANGDELHLSLLEPVADVRKLASGSVDLRISGDIARWKSRIASFVTLPPYVMSGSIVASGNAKFAAEQITVDRLTLGLTNVKFVGAGLNINERTMNAVGDFTLTRATNTATITKITLNSVPLIVTNGTLTFAPQKNGEIAVSGTGQGGVDLNRAGTVLKLYADPFGPDALAGRGVGPIRFHYAGDVTTFGGTLDVTNFTYGPRQKPLWNEPTLRLEVDGSYTDSTDTVALTLAKAERAGLILDAKGSIGKVSTVQDVNLTGTLNYDWAKLTPFVRGLLGGNFTATGSGTRAIALTGQLSPPGIPPAKPAATPSFLAATNGDLAIGWTSIKAYGFDMGTGDLNGKMTRGVLAVSPINATFCGGKVTLTPTVKLDTAPGQVILAKGSVIDRAKLTPQATAGALGYALPAIANSTQAEGDISASIDENHIPLDDFNKISLKGTLVIHKATVTAGPVAAEVAKLLGAANTTMTLANESTVPIQVANGRVYHQNFAVRIGGTTFHTNGSVGFDDTLDLVVDVPLPKDLPMLKNNPILVKEVAGKVLKVPVKGTLTKPVIDAKAFENAVIALIRAGAKDAGKDLLHKELNKLFPGMPAPGTNPNNPGKLLPFPLPFGKRQ